MEYVAVLTGIAVIHFFAISSPGPTLFVVAGHANATNPSAGFFVVVGVVMATLVWATFAAAGLNVLMNAVPWLPVVIRIAGGAYLAWFGYKMIRSALKKQSVEIADAEIPPIPPLVALRNGFVTNISNPKVIAYYVSLFGVMIPAAAPVWFYGAVVLTAASVSAAWWAVVAVFFRLPVVRSAFKRIRRVFNFGVGAVLVAFGMKLISGR
ncbi:MAG: LysE family transporter [Rhizobiaceae bacterium]